MLIKVNKSYLFFEKIENGIISDYLRYIIDIIKSILETNDIYINIIFGNVSYNFSNKYKVIKIGYNIEHTLVLEGGRSISNNCPKGSIKTDNNSNYLIRIDNFFQLNTNDIIIEYSIPNIINIGSNEYFQVFYNKLIYISPMLYTTYNFNNTERNNNVLTTFYNPNESRRKTLLDTFVNNNIDVVNINNCFDINELQTILLNTKILVNIHQTEHHHTFEELRCLPALLNGVIVISEKSPLYNDIPYSDMIIWSSINDIVQVVRDVLNNYDMYHSSIFTSTHKTLFDKLHQNNIIHLKDKILLEYRIYTSLAELAELYLLDKSITTNNHNYIPGYSKLFDKVRSDVKTILEIGIGSLENGQMGGVSGPLANLGYKTGNSLRCWRDYFHNANIYGIDIFDIKINETRIITHQADQSNNDDLLRVVTSIDRPIDIIIDDGSHNYQHQISSFMFLEKYLSKNGIYVIEDIQPPYIDGFKDLSIFPNDFRKYVTDMYDINYFDTRHIINRADDFMISFTKK